MTTSATLDSASVQLRAGEEAVIPLQIRNNGETVEGYRIEVVGPSSDWASVEPETVSLYPGSSTTATVSFHPPRSSDVPAGELQFGVVVLPTDHPDDAVVPEGVVEVLPFLDTTAELLPRTSQGRRQGRHQVAIDNRGNIAVTTLLAAADPTGRLGFRAPTQGLTVAPGEASFADVRVRPPKLVWSGAPLTHPFTVEVAPQDSSSVVLDGTYVQQPVLPPWLGKALVALLAALVALAVVWFVLLRPTIRSAAENAIAPQVAKVSQDATTTKKQAGAAKKQAQQATGAAGSAQSAAADAGKSAVVARNIAHRKPEQPPYLTVPLARRLEVKPRAGAKKTAFYPVKARSAKITDLVMSNPQGDFGRVTVSMAGQKLFDMALENFRDIDYHFVEPIVGNHGDSLSMAVSCRAVGRPPEDKSAPKTCDTGMYFGGQLVKVNPKATASASASPSTSPSTSPSPTPSPTSSPSATPSP